MLQIRGQPLLLVGEEEIIEFDFGPILNSATLTSVNSGPSAFNSSTGIKEYPATSFML